MHIIPVIDILNGTVVHARRGRRNDYRPIQSRLCAGSDPESVVDALLDLYPFPAVYVADLDAVENKGNNDEAIRRLADRFPDLEFWLDRGNSNTLADTIRQIVPVTATENGLSCRQLIEIRHRYPHTVLSLDFNDNGLIGDDTILKNGDDWPQRCIVMTLHRVGADEGPDMERFRFIRDRAPDRSLYAAGGIRDVRDLHSLAAAGAAGALLASALHNGSITTETLKAFFSKNLPQRTQRSQS